MDDALIEGLKTKLSLIVAVGSLSTRPEYVEATSPAKNVAKKFKGEGVDPLSAAIVLEFFARTLAQAAGELDNSAYLGQSYLFAATAFYLLED